jgi:hypothetical protein
VRVSDRLNFSCTTTWFLVLSCSMFSFICIKKSFLLFESTLLSIVERSGNEIKKIRKRWGRIRLLYVFTNLSFFIRHNCVWQTSNLCVDRPIYCFPSFRTFWWTFISWNTFVWICWHIIFVYRVTSA